MRFLNRILLAGGLMAALLAFGCGGKEFVYESDRELKPGPGIFSGPDGEFTIFRTTIPKPEQPEQPAPTEPEEPRPE